MNSMETLHKKLEINLEQETTKIADRVREILTRHLHRRGLVVAVSGGIDSSVSAALCVRAIGAKKVFALLLPETDSSSASTERGLALVKHLGVEHLLVDIAPTLEAIGCYRWRDEAIRETFPEYGTDWKNKIVIEGGMSGSINRFQLVVQSPDGETKKKRLDLKAYLQIVAATNFKQRIRKTLEFFHADRLNYAVVGTPNRLEYDQGFFVKNGDGAADLKPIAHLYKTQVYALARHLGLPEDICAAVPSTDTYSLPQGQDEFYYALPHDKMDLALYAHNEGMSAKSLADIIDVSVEHAQYIFKDIDNKRKTTAILHWSPLLIEKVEGPLPRPESA